jgi:hypothetical protein
MIRTFIPLDVFDLLAAGRSLSNKARTKDSLGRRDGKLSNIANILGDWFNPQFRPGVWVYSEGLALRGLASVRERRSPHAWEINRLMVDEQDRNACLMLLEYLSAVGVQRHIERIFLHLPLSSPLLKVAEEAGFGPYSTEHLYWIKREDDHEARSGTPPASTPRRKKVDDEYRLFELYLKCVPANVRRAEGMTYQEWQGNRAKSVGQEWVFERDGGFVGWAAIGSNHGWGQLDMMATREDIQSVVEYGLASLSDCSQLYCLAPDSEGMLLRLLENRGFSRVMTYSALTKELLVRVAKPYAMPAVPA